jgi:cytochrome d ubiquinol oxidase subunit II
MATVWFVILAVMLAVYTALDGYDFGVGALYLYVARTHQERGTVLAAIGPLWDGNEVWLIAAGGVLFFAFPLVYASAFSGLYLALFLVLWLLIGRGLAIELRHQVHNQMWTDFWDLVFSAASLTLALLFGVALGNVLRGLPLNAEGYFFLPLWTNLSPTAARVGILDWYTVLMGLLAVVVLSMHGGHFLAFKTTGAIAERAFTVSKRLYWAAAALTLCAVIATPMIQPLVVQRYWTHPIGFVLPVAGIVVLVAVYVMQRRGNALNAFYASAAFILLMLSSAAYGIYPSILIATTGAANTLTVDNASAPLFGLKAGIVWFSVAAVLFLGYTAYMYRTFRGTVEGPMEEGY